MHAVVHQASWIFLQQVLDTCSKDAATGNLTTMLNTTKTTQSLTRPRSVA